MTGKMIPRDWRDLAVTSVRDPGTAARTLMAMKFESGPLWNALVLVAVANTMLFTLSNMILPGPSPLPEILSTPLVYFGVVAGGLALTAISLFWTGRMMGGKGSLAEILVLIVWMQALRVLVQVVALILVFVIPVLSELLVLAAGLVGIFMLVHFVKQAHQLESTGRAIAILVVSVLVIVIGLSAILTLIGGPYVGSTLNV